MERVHAAPQNTPGLNTKEMAVGKSEASATQSPAEVYDEFFVPALFHQWGKTMAEIARLGPGQRVLDVACGTGVLTAAAADRVGAAGAAVGLDPNPEMLAVARRKHASVDWKSGRAEALPFTDASFDRCVSQFGLMFFEDRVAALREMMRVLRPNGRLAVAVCDALDHSPGYAVLAELLHRLFGHQVAQAFRAPFVLGDAEELLSLCSDAGIARPRVERYDGTVRFNSIAALVSTERACVWTLGGLLDEAQFERLLQAADESLRPFTAADGTVSFCMPALVITADN
jgi:ubiquinone/menaquinone biosynthesis C-methylase UbiE